MSMTDVLDDDLQLNAPHLVEILQDETPPRGRALATITEQDLTKLSAVHFAPITAQVCPVKRVQADVLRQIKEDAAMAGQDFFYSFPVKKKGGGVDYIEGISIDGAMAVLSAYGNAEVDCRPVDIGHSWIFLARFIDQQRGVSLIRPFIQPKTGATLGGTDEARKMQIAFNIGASKATRNVVANAIRPYTNFCFEEAKKDLVKRVGANLESNRASVLKHLEALKVPLKTVEAQLARTAQEWTAREIAGLITQIKAIRDGMTTVADAFPTPVPEPTRRDAETAAPEASATPPQTTRPQAQGGGTDDGQNSSPPTEPSSVSSDWTVPADVIGQDHIVRALDGLLGKAKTAADLDLIERSNAERIGKFGGVVKSNWNNAVRSRREQLK